MRQLSLTLPLAVALALAAPLAAQNAECQPYAGLSQTRNVCNAAVDGTRAFHPVVGLLTSGGNPVLGRQGSLGGLGRFAITGRVNATEVVLPDLAYDGSTAVVGKDEELFFPSPLLEAAVGVLGGSSAVGLDLLGSAQLLPTDIVNGLEVDSSATSIGSVALGFGVGGRVSLFDGGTLPALSVSLMRRSVPRVRYGDVNAGDDYAYAADVQAWNLRASVGKRLSVLALAAGLGQDWYDGEANIRFRDPFSGLPAAPIDLDLSTSRTMGFVNAGLDFSYVRIVAEAGYQFGKDQGIATVFQDFDPASGRFFAAAGLTLGL
ncbi:MAG TPA: hypothetical protein VFU46_06980 [Gemmatimonadales bacterium]|nr:hypothetical protein [Gemmatimonadales bacterium]